MIKIKLDDEKAVMPTKADSGSSGWDLYAIDDGCVLGFNSRTIVDTGLIFEMPEGYEAQIRPRSGLAAKHGVTVLNTPGTIDASYRGRVKVILINHSEQTFEFNAGDRIAQVVFEKLPFVEVEEVDQVGSTERGTGGFGSTGQ